MKQATTNFVAAGYVLVNGEPEDTEIYASKSPFSAHQRRKKSFKKKKVVKDDDSVSKSHNITIREDKNESEDDSADENRMSYNELLEANGDLKE